MAKNNQKKPEPKPAPPADQQQTQAPPAPAPVRPMAVHPPTQEEQIEALTLRLKVAEDWITKHNRYHFGGVSQG